MRKITLSFLCCLISSLGFSQDDCASAIAITEGIYTVDAIDGTEVPSPICAANGGGATAGEWYTYTAQENLGLTITTDLSQNQNQDPQADTRFHVYTGTCGDLVCRSGDDDAGTGFLSIAQFNVEAGTTYYIAFDNKWNSSGFDFQIIEGAVIAEPETIITFTSTSSDTDGTQRALVDMNGDYLDDIVSISTTNVNIRYQQTSGDFTTANIETTSAENSPSWSLSAGDIDGNGYNDLLYGGASGVTFMIANDSGTGFSQISGSEYVFSQRSNFVDINNDGHLDAFVCHDVEPNVYYINDGNGNLTFNQGGLGDTVNGGNYGSIWIDYDNDRDMDLFIAKCRGGNSGANINQLHENDGSGNFTEVSTAMNLADPVQTWSSAWGDFDNDGDMDAFIGASSFTNGGHKFMRNDESTFTDVITGTGLENFEDTDIEYVTHDFDNNGYLDIYSGSGNFFFNNGDMTFTQQIVNFGAGPIGDLNNDGFLDILSGNIYMNDGNDNNWLKITTEGVQSNWNGIGARIEIQSAMGSQMRDIRSGDGFRYMSSLNAHFGIGTDTEIESVTIYWPSGIVDTILNPTINETLFVQEGQTLSIKDNNALQLNVYPNPTHQYLYVEGLQNDTKNASLQIVGVQGKQVNNAKFNSNRVDVSQLSNGIYFATITINNQSQTLKFVKD
ncbi:MULTISPECIES: FG-GAP-like repeat-containing protein [Croceibacter]|uniref:FG-GAP-like repeat-containing protein n=1 Tax=Croceibacter TaxID=216431 RepID=UPI002357B4D7|nr:MULTISPECIES: FG-GAP-like repeat-containing protein [Croceibacter]|tara:strand:- start:6996 stop:9008 length:2013 start_codon:yes stop_codon:yes gene_type:complete